VGVEQVERLLGLALSGEDLSAERDRYEAQVGGTRHFARVSLRVGETTGLEHEPREPKQRRGTVGTDNRHESLFRIRVVRGARSGQGSIDRVRCG
jgi:hypothetical protein